MRKFFKILFIGISALFAIVAIVVFLLWFNFEALLNSDFARSKLKQLTESSEIQYDSSCLRFEVKRQGLLKKKIDLKLTNCKIVISNLHEISVASAKVTVLLNLSIKNIIVVEDANLKIAHVRVGKGEPDPSASENGWINISEVVDLIGSILNNVAVVNHLDVAVQGVELNESTQLKNVEIIKSGPTTTYNYEASAFLSSMSVHAKGAISNQEQLKLDLNLSVSQPKVLSGKVTLESVFGSEEASVNIVRAKVSVNGHLIDIDSCKIESSYELSQVSVTPCELKAVPSPDIYPEIREAFKANELATNINLELIRSSDILKLNAKVGPFGNEIFSLKANSEIEFKIDEIGQMDNILNRLIYNSDIDLSIFKFEVVQALVKGAGVQLPAPLNQFDGTLKISSKGGKGEQRTDFDFLLDLKNKVDFLKFSGHGTIDNKKIELNAEVQNSHLTLPDIGKKVERITVLPDDRFEKKKPELSKTTQQQEKRQVFIHLKNVAGAAFRVKHKSFKKAIPVVFDLHIKPDGTEGEIKVNDFDFETLKRKIKLQYLTLGLKKSEEPKISAKVEVDFAEYDIFVEVYGPTSRPNLKLSSEPPLSRQEIISVLLFEKKIDLLSDETRGSVQNTEAAIADSAFTLASLYFLASTPIESVSYDPTAKAVVTRVALRDGTVVTVGVGDSSVSRVGLSQRLGKGWYFNTGISSLSEDGSSELSALIEKIFRY